VVVAMVHQATNLHHIQAPVVLVVLVLVVLMLAVLALMLLLQLSIAQIQTKTEASVKMNSTTSSKVDYKKLVFFSSSNVSLLYLM
jgi:hypothetical protein